jgi:hypothetical protein
MTTSTEPQPYPTYGDDAPASAESALWVHQVPTLVSGIARTSYRLLR